MMENLIESLAQYGPLGLWTASLLWNNWQMQKERLRSVSESRKALAYHQEFIVMKLVEQEHMLEKALEKLDDGLSTIKQKEIEYRISKKIQDK
jgi:hypothetical protein